MARAASVERDAGRLRDGGDRPAAAASGATWPTMKPRVAPGEASVGDQRHRVAEPGADDRGRDAEHLAHARAAARPFVADHDDVAAVMRPPCTAANASSSRVEDARRAPVRDAVVPGDLDDAAIRREIAAQDHQAAGRLERRGRRPDRPPGPGVSTRLGRFSRSVRPVTVRASPCSAPDLEQALRERGGCRRPRTGRSRRSGRPASGPRAAARAR